MTIDKALEQFILSCKLKGLSKKTIVNYTDFIKRFIMHDEIVEVADIDLDLINNYILYLYDEELSRSTISTYIRHLKVFIRWLEDHDQVKDLVENIKVPKEEKKVLRIYNDKEIKMIYGSINTSPEWMYYRNAAIISLMLDSGFRQSEVCNLDLNDIQFEDRIIKIKGKGNKERFVPLGFQTEQDIKWYLTLVPYKINDKLFLTKHGQPMQENTIKLLITKMRKKLKFELCSHKLRHNFATHYCLDHYEKYGQIDIYKLMVLLGHEEINTTRRYLHLANQIIASKEHLSHLDKIMTKNQESLQT